MPMKSIAENGNGPTGQVGPFKSGHFRAAPFADSVASRAATAEMVVLRSATDIQTNVRWQQFQQGMQRQRD